MCGAGVNAVVSEVWGKGGKGGIQLANEVVKLVEGENDFHFVYEDDLTLKEKIGAVASKIYRADGLVILRRR